MMTPAVVVTLLTQRSEAYASSGNRRHPDPRTSGWIKSTYSSISPGRISDWTAVEVLVGPSPEQQRTTLSHRLSHDATHHLVVVSTAQPPCANPLRRSSSGRPGACITPSRLRLLMTTTLLIGGSCRHAPARFRRLTPYTNGRGANRHSRRSCAPVGVSGPVRRWSWILGTPGPKQQLCGYARGDGVAGSGIEVDHQPRSVSGENADRVLQPLHACSAAGRLRREARCLSSLFGLRPQDPRLGRVAGSAAGGSPGGCGGKASAYETPYRAGSSSSNDMSTVKRHSLRQ